MIARPSWCSCGAPAAAPELLAALRELADSHSKAEAYMSPQEMERATVAWRDAKAVIARAEGMES